MKRLKVGLSGINNVDNPGPGVGIARSIREDKTLNAEIIGLAYDAMEPGIYMDWLIDKSFMMPYPSGDPESYLERLLHIKKSHGLDIVIPNLDAELPFYIKYQDRLRDLGIMTFLPDIKQFKLRGKDRLADIAKTTGLTLPETRLVNTVEDLSDAAAELNFPLMVKGVFYKAKKATTLNEAISHFHYIAAEWGYPVLLQEVVSGDELNVIALGSGTGETMAMVGIKKLWITELGKIWTGVTVKNHRMLEATETFINTYQWKGPLELECMVDGDTIYLIEINPRFPAWSYFATGVGVNLPSIMIRKLLDKKIPEKAGYEAGKLFIRYTYELITEMDLFQNMVTQGET